MRLTAGQERETPLPALRPQPAWAARASTPRERSRRPGAARLLAAAGCAIAISRQRWHRAAASERHGVWIAHGGGDSAKLYKELFFLETVLPLIAFKIVGTGTGRGGVACKKPAGLSVRRAEWFGSETCDEVVVGANCYSQAFLQPRALSHPPLIMQNGSKLYIAIAPACE